MDEKNVPDFYGGTKDSRCPWRNKRFKTSKAEIKIFYVRCETYVLIHMSMFETNLSRYIHAGT
jgi:hypothetical protein